MLVLLTFAAGMELAYQSVAFGSPVHGGAYGVDTMPTVKTPPRTDPDVRRIVHRYFYDRNKPGTSMRGKKGISAKISVVQRELKAVHGLNRSEVTRAVAYLIDQKWVMIDDVNKTFTTPQGTAIPSTVSYYRITAQGVDKIDG